METTLKFNLPPMQGGKLIRVDKEKEGVRDAAVEKELKAEERREKRQRKKEEQERAKELARQQDMEVDSVKQVENDRDKDSQVREQGSLRVCLLGLLDYDYVSDNLGTGAYRKGWFVQG